MPSMSSRRRHACSMLLVVVVVASILSLTQVEAATITEWTIPTSSSDPQGISVSGGLVYFAETAGNKIGRSDPATGVFAEWATPAGDSPLGIFVSGGVVYFTESNNKIGRLDPATGVFTEWTVPTANSQPYAIFVSGGLVYFAELSGLGNKIGRLDPATGVFIEWTILGPVQSRDLSLFIQILVGWSTSPSRTLTGLVVWILPLGFLLNGPCLRPAHSHGVSLLIVAWFTSPRSSAVRLVVWIRDGRLH